MYDELISFPGETYVLDPNPKYDYVEWDDQINTLTILGIVGEFDDEFALLITWGDSFTAIEEIPIDKWNEKLWSLIKL